MIARHLAEGEQGAGEPSTTTALAEVLTGTDHEGKERTKRKIATDRDGSAFRGVPCSNLVGTLPTWWLVAS